MAMRTDDFLSSEARDLLDSQPGRILYWATSGLFLLVCTVLISGYLVTIPETIRGTMTLTTTEPPASVIATTDGYLWAIKVADRDLARKGDILAIYASTARVEDVLNLENELELLSEFEVDRLRNFSPNKSLNVGELSLAYTNFINAFDFLPYELERLSSDLPPTSAPNYKAANLRNSVKSLKSKLTRIDNQIDSLWRKFNAAKTNYERTSNEIYANEQFSARDRIDELQAEREIAEQNIQALQRELLDENASQLESRLRQREGAQSELYRFKQELGNLKSAIARWRELHLITAPSDGRVFLYRDLKENTFIQKGQELMVIFPEKKQLTYIAQVSIGTRGSGKVKEGQRVTLHFSRYPSSTYGVVSGEVAKTYSLPKGDEYFVEVRLPDGLRSNKGLQLEFNYRLTGTAAIYTDEKVLFAYLFNELRSPQQGLNN